MCRDASALPRWPLAGAKHPLADDDIVAAICDARMLSKLHDGFHMLSTEWTLTHTNLLPVRDDPRRAVRLACPTHAYVVSKERIRQRKT